MKPAIKILIVVLALLLVGGILTSAVVRVRHAAARMSCANNLKQLGMALATHHDSVGYLPVGTTQGTDLSPHKRLSWLVHIYPTYVEGCISTPFECTKPWDDPVNYPPRGRGKDEPGDFLLGQIKTLLCPATPVPHDPDHPSPTH
jgi:hypothetical protein